MAKPKEDGFYRPNGKNSHSMNDDYDAGSVDITGDSMSIFEHLEDTLQTVPFTKMATAKEKSVYLGLKTLRNQIDAAAEHHSNKSAKAKGIYANSVRTTSALLGQINEMNQGSLSNEMQLVKAALVFALGKQKKILKEL